MSNRKKYVTLAPAFGRYEPVAQMDRALVCGAKGRAFDSRRAHHEITKMQDIYQILDDIGIKYDKREHPAVFTCEQADRYYDESMGGKSKNLLLRNRKGDVHYLVVLQSDKKLDLKKLETLFGESKLSFASEERLMKHLGLTPGSVSPFGLINDAEKAVKVVIDNDLWTYPKLHFHPNTNTASLVIATEDFKKFLDWCGNRVTSVNL